MSLDATTSRILRSLLLDRGVAALATLHEGRPFASMVSFAVVRLAGGLRVVTHVSGLAAHTRDMRMHPEVCLMVTAVESADVMPQALPRVSIPAIAEFIPPEHDDYGLLKAAYLTRHPQAAGLFQLGDFSLVAFTPLSARLVAGFGSAQTLGLETLAEVAAAGIV